MPVPISGSGIAARLSGKGVRLAFDRVDGARPESAIAFMHGILGRGINLRTIAKRFVEARPGWTAWLVDLRGHGRSPKGTPKPSASIDPVSPSQELRQYSAKASSG